MGYCKPRVYQEASECMSFCAIVLHTHTSWIDWVSGWQNMVHINALIIICAVTVDGALFLGWRKERGKSSINNVDNVNNVAIS